MDGSGGEAVGPRLRALPDPLDAHAAGPLRVLLVEDDDGDALLVEEWVADSDLVAEITWVRCLADARRHLADGPDCVLLDLHLPDASGIDSLSSLLASAPDLPLIVVTGLHDESAGAAAVAAGAQDYLVKGQIDASTLARAIRYAVERKRAAVATEQLREIQRHSAENVRLERGLLPKPIVRDGALTVDVRYQPGRRRALLGGDFYDLVQTSDGTVRVLIGDVSGHGPDEAAVGACLRICWRTAVLAGIADLGALDLLEQVLVVERPTSFTYATVCVMTIAADRSSATIYTAGHPPPLLVGDRAVPMELHQQPPIGLLRTAVQRRAQRVTLPVGSELLLYTDGLIDGRVGDGDQRLGVDGLAAMVTDLGAAAGSRLVDRVVAAVVEADGGQLADDMAAVHVRWVSQ